MASKPPVGPKPLSGAAPVVVAPIFEEFHTQNVQSYGERPRDSMRTLHVSYSYLTEEPHITLEFAASDATLFGPRASVHLKALSGVVPWKLAMGDVMTAKAHVNNRLTGLKIQSMMHELYKIKQKDAEKQCAMAIADAQEKQKEASAAEERKSQAKKVQNGGIFG